MVDFLIPLIVTALAEFGDKTQLSILILSTKMEKHLHLLIGVVVAFLLVDGIAVSVGSWITNVVPVTVLRIASGIVFIIFGVLILTEREVKKIGKSYSRSPFLSGFVLILITEWGDKTQITSAIFATKYNPLLVLSGAVAALTLLSGMVLYLGKSISNKVDKRLMTKIAGTIFILMGISFFLF